MQLHAGACTLSTMEPTLLRSTLRALVAPRRAVAIAALAVPLVVAQARLSVPPQATAIGLAMCLGFVLLAPVSWRALFPPERGPATAPFGRLFVYVGAGTGTVLGLGVALPHALDIGETFMTRDAALVVAVALFCVGGYGLGRDIDLELSLGQALERERVLAREAEHARLLAVRNNLDPHFLFNTLNAIAEWCRIDGEVAERAVVMLSDMLRSVLEATRREAWPLTVELALCRQLVELHRIRDPDGLDLAVEIDPACERESVPPLILLPLVENAIKHGQRGGAIRVGAVREGRRVRLWVDSPGHFRGPRPGGEGLALVRRRLRHAWGTGAELFIAEIEGETRARIVAEVPA
jgi:signal transduction histidine kinase